MTSAITSLQQSQVLANDEPDTKTVLIIALSTAGALLLIFAIGGAIYCCTQRKRVRNARMAQYAHTTHRVDHATHIQQQPHTMLHVVPHQYHDDHKGALTDSPLPLTQHRRDHYSFAV